MRTNLKINCAALALATLPALVAGGCRGRSPARAEAATRPAVSGDAVQLAGTARASRPGTPFTLASGTPAGGLRVWIGEVRQGLKPIPQEAQGDAAGAQHAALELYLTHQEYIEMYWGVAGTLTRGGALGPAVKEAETRFHVLLAQLQPGKVPPASTLRADIAALSEQYDRVIAAAEEARVPLDPHALVPVASSGAASSGAAPGGRATR